MNQKITFETPTQYDACGLSMRFLDRPVARDLSSGQRTPFAFSISLASVTGIPLIRLLSSAASMNAKISIVTSGLMGD